MSHRMLVVLVTAIGCTSAVAQTYHTAPSGYATVEGLDMNSIPWWTASATYQQVHDAIDLSTVFGGPFAAITSINFRMDSWMASVPGRSIDAQITLGATPVTASTMSSVFASNLGPSPGIVLPYTTISLSTLTYVSTPNPIGWRLPFQTPFAYATSTGNLCWELRFTNGTLAASSPMDAVSRLNAITYGNVGLGCRASGQSLVASIGERSLSMFTGAWRNRLDRGAANASAVQLMGFSRVTTTLPGFCGGLEILPVASQASVTDGAGQWDSTLTFGSLLDLPTTEILSQFAWIDPGLPNGIGLSDASRMALPPDALRHIGRVYVAPYQGGLGSETAISGRVDTQYGLVTIFGL